MVVDTRFAPGTASEAVAKMVGGIVSFTRWPVDPVPLRLCVTGAARYADRIGEASRTAGRAISVRRIAADASVDGCDALYLGAMPADASRRLIATIRNRAVLSIAESDPTCRSGAMFCLAVGTNSLTFQLSVDAISRGTVRVDPRVLRVAGPSRGDS
ncbi:MAG: YfiR family protein [Sphingomonas sp.]